MEKLLKKGYSGIIAQFNAIQVLDSQTQEVHADLQLVLNKHQQVFEIPKNLPPSRGEHDHGIPLILGSQPPNVHPYRHPFSQKNEIEKIIHELLEAGFIRPNTIPYSSPVVMVLKKEGD